MSRSVLLLLTVLTILSNSTPQPLSADDAKPRKMSGVVAKVADFAIVLENESQRVEFHAPQGNRLVVHEVGQLATGDKVTISWVEEGGKKWIRDVEGRGILEGMVTARGDAWIEVESKGRKVRYCAPWKGGNPSEGGGPDREVVRMIARAAVGSRVEIAWAMPEGKRVTHVSVRKAPTKEPGNRGDLTKAPPELYGLSGRVLGRLVSADPEKGELTLKIVKVDRVWKNNKAKEPKSAEGRTLKIDGVFGKFLDVLLTLKKGDGVQIEVKHVQGDGLTFLGEELKRVDIQEEEKPKPDGDGSAAGRAPLGMKGFRGIMIGTLESKDVEKGTLVFKMEKVKRVWKKNQAPAPEKSFGKSITVQGISGKFLDTLLVLKSGDRIEVEAFHVSGPTLNFPGEWLKKIE